MTPSKTKSNDLTFEQAYRRLETIVDSLERGESTLEESLKAFEEGIELAKFCSQKLQDAELRLQKLVKGEDGSFQLELIQ
jgi:exodeoxyribonuclease VII small subunit